jgi:hypothetical protein
MSDVMDPETMEEPLLSQVAPVDQERLVLEDDTIEKWRKRADGQIYSLVRVFCSMAALTVLGILWICLVTIVDYDDIGMPLPVDEFLTYVGGVIVVSAVISVCAQRIIERNREIAVDDDCKDAKKRREDDNRCQFWSLFLFISALLFTLVMILCSITGVERHVEPGNHHFFYPPNYREVYLPLDERE